MMTDDQNDPTWKRDDEPESEHPSRQESPREFGNRENPPDEPDPSNIDEPTLESSEAIKDKKLIPSATEFYEILAECADRHRAGEEVDLEGLRKKYPPTWIDRLQKALQEEVEDVRSARQEPSQRHIGSYKILSTIGEGGMGIVFRALQTDPIRRDVAVKIIKLGMNTREIIARFESERQALAQMDHPNIAKILGAGTTEDRRPYFAMESVKGIPLTDYCDKQKLGIRKRLDLFKQICLAVQHAHQKAIIHRDLKPSNILVTDQQGEPGPRIIDFGLAKALGGHRLTEQTFFTAQGVMMGTPEYMSPEQADPTALDIDTRTDIYSLGVILYQLLAGVLPIEIKDRHIEAIRRSVCDEEPQKPSTRIRSSPDLGSQVAALRQMDHSSLMRRLKGDLDWITMKALDKDRNRRYGTASDLAADIDRHLNHEPVSAGPPSGGYILKKFVRKHVGAVVASAAVFLAVLAGGGIATVFYFQADEKRVEAEEATKREAIQREKAQEAETKADQRLDEILRLSDIKKLMELRDQADLLWPAYPSRVEAMKAWLADARKLTGNLDEHRETLVKLREEEAVAKPQDREDEQSADEENETTVQWTFAETEIQWRHDVLSELVLGLKELVDPDPQVGLIADVGARLVFARTVREETIERYDVEWEEAIASISNEKGVATLDCLLTCSNKGRLLYFDLKREASFADI